MASFLRQLKVVVDDPSSNKMMQLFLHQVGPSARWHVGRGVVVVCPWFVRTSARN